MKLNKKAEESTSYLGGKTVNVILGVIVALFIVFVIGRFVYSYVQGENDLQKAGKQMQNVLEKIDYVREDRISDSITIYPPVNWYLKSDDEGDIKDTQCLIGSCLCICEIVSCNGENRICKGFDYKVEIDESYFQQGTSGNIAGAGFQDYPNTIKLKSIERLRIDKINPASEEDSIRIRRIE